MTEAGGRRRAHRRRAPRPAVRALSHHHVRPAHRRPPAAGRAARGRRCARHRALPPSRSRLRRAGVATKDVPGLFALIAGTLAAEGINVLSAQIHTRADGIALDTFQVNDPFGEAVTEEARWRRTLERAAPRAAGRGQRGGSAGAAPRRPPRAARAVAGPPKISVDNQISDSHTVVEVKCPDRVGLLYLITRTLPVAGPRHRQRAYRHRDRAGLRHLLRDGPAGPPRRGRGRDGPRSATSLEDALLKPL